MFLFFFFLDSSRRCTGSQSADWGEALIQRPVGYKVLTSGRCSSHKLINEEITGFSPAPLPTPTTFRWDFPHPMLWGEAWRSHDWSWEFCPPNINVCHLSDGAHSSSLIQSDRHTHTCTKGRTFAQIQTCSWRKRFFTHDRLFSFNICQISIVCFKKFGCITGTQTSINSHLQLSKTHVKMATTTKPFPA